jgi:hypothetical protein
VAVGAAPKPKIAVVTTPAHLLVVFDCKRIVSEGFGRHEYTYIYIHRNRKSKNGKKHALLKSQAITEKSSKKIKKKEEEKEKT